MAKKKRRAFPGDTARPEPRRDSSRASNEPEIIDADSPGFGIFGWFRNPGTRETIESIIIAVLLAFMFKTYEAEAFVIPTGSMAPSLQGQHMDLDCEQCGYRYLTGASYESSSNARAESTYCPICNYRTEMKPKSDPEHRSNSGDRILVNKFIYDFKEPERYDVIVFKYPNNAKQNYIKRLIGLPGDNILIENGDVYLMDKVDENWNRRISRKPPAKLKQVLIDVDDTKYIGKKLKEVDWPSRWAQWDGGKQWSLVNVSGEDVWNVASSANESWLRYRHLAPSSSQWPTILGDQLPTEMDRPLDELPAGRLITDAMAYNDGRYSDHLSKPPPRIPGVAYHWVGDIGIETWCDVVGDSGELLLDIVEGGVHFTCRFDVATGKATLHCSNPSVRFETEDGAKVEVPQADTGVTKGSHHLLMVNADDQIHLWVDDRLVSFDTSKYCRPGMPVPTYSKEDAGDAEPVGIGTKDLEVTVNRLKVVRDIYYSSVKREQDGEYSNSNETRQDPRMLEVLFRSPEQWSSDKAGEVFGEKRNQPEPMFCMEKGETPEKDQFFPMGDNSTASLDARVWPGPDNFVERDLLIGRAIFVYWPHTLNEPIPYFPNFGKMKFIR